MVQTLIRHILPQLSEEDPEAVAVLLEKCMTDLGHQGVTLDADDETREMLLGAESADVVGLAEAELPSAIQAANVDFQRVADQIREDAQKAAQKRAGQPRPLQKQAPARPRYEPKPSGVTWTAAAARHDLSGKSDMFIFLALLEKTRLGNSTV